MSFLKRLFSSLFARKKLMPEDPNNTVEHADTSNYLPLDPKNDPWGRT